MGELRAYAALLGGKARSMASYRTSFAIELLSNLGSTVLDVVTVFVLYRATATVGGFTLTESLLMTGLTAAGFVLADLTVGNIDDLKRYVRAGTLDTVLIRPLRVLPQLIFMDLPLRKLLRLAFGIFVYVAALVANQGLAASIVLAVVLTLVAVGVYLPAASVRTVLVLALVVSAVIWVVGEACGMVLAGGATDPNSGPLLALLALAYWPARGAISPAAGPGHPHPAGEEGTTDR